jgi:hypothetical protein
MLSEIFMSVVYYEFFGSYSEIFISSFEKFHAKIFPLKNLYDKEGVSAAYQHRILQHL